jgi:hypothetical protein
VKWFDLASRAPGVTVHPAEVNGGPGALFHDGTTVCSASSPSTSQAVR